MKISWAVKKQITYLAVFAVVVLIVLTLIIISITKPTCSDNRQNQDEEGIDCGGSCAEQCLGEIKSLITLWVKPLEIGDKSYDVAALIENPNLNLGVASLGYKLKIYDENNILVALQEGETFVNPGERFVLFEPNVDTGHRVPKRAFIEFAKNIEWERVEKEKDNFSISKKEFSNDGFPRLDVIVKNTEPLPTYNIQVATVLYDSNRNVKAVSTSHIDSIAGDGSRDVVFTWPQTTFQAPDLIDVFLRKDLTE